LEYFEDYNLSLTQRLGKIAVLGQPPRGPGWGRDSDRAGNWGRGSGYLTEDTETLPLSSVKGLIKMPDRIMNSSHLTLY
jgi:hypothetical protein